MRTVRFYARTTARVVVQRPHCRQLEFQLKDFDITSSIEVDNLLIENNYKLKSIFPKIKKKLNLSNHKLKIVYNQKNLRINGNGGILIQNENDYIDYQVNKKK